MINKKAVAALTETAAQLAADNAFPEPSWRSPFHKFEGALNEVLHANDLGRCWEFDPDSRTFCRTFDGMVNLGGYRGKLTITMTLDPCKPLADEIERLQTELEAFDARCSLAYHNPWAPVFSGLSMEEMQCLFAGLKTLVEGAPLRDRERWGETALGLLNQLEGNLT